MRGEDISATRIRWSILLVCTVLLLFVFATDGLADDDDAGRVARGARIYHLGLLGDGRPLAGTVRDPLPGMNVACVSCHRRSGLGGREGGELVPALTGDYLFKDHLKLITKPTLRRIKRWAYTEASFDRALRKGIDVMGDPISRVMPRYALPEEDRDALIAYLKTLVYPHKPGIDADTVHIATVVDKRLPAVEREALIEVARRYVAQENRAIQAREKRAAFSERQNNWGVKSFRRWRLHLWELEGEPDTWRKQLDDDYGKQPVFILVGGAVAGEWQPIDRFCEARKLPCVLPHTDLPARGESSHFTFYFSRGLQLEADVLASRLHSETPATTRLVQIYRDGAAGRYAARGLRESATQRGMPVEDRRLPADGVLSADDLAWMDSLSDDTAVMLWLDRESLSQLVKLRDGKAARGSYYASSSLLGTGLTPTRTAWDERIRLIHPFELPWQPTAGVSQGFLNKQGILSDQVFRLQSETFAAFAAVSQVMRRVRHELVREYFMEQLEHLSEDLHATSVYPRFSLGPYQRIVSKGAYLFPLSELGRDRHDSYPWVIPGQ